MYNLIKQSCPYVLVSVTIATPVFMSQFSPHKLSLKIAHPVRQIVCTRHILRVVVECMFCNRSAAFTWLKQNCCRHFWVFEQPPINVDNKIFM